MSEVVSFRPSREELEAIERWRRQRGARSRADAVKQMIRRAQEREQREGLRPLLEFRVAPKHRLRGTSLTSQEIDEELYGGKP